MDDKKSIFLRLLLNKYNQGPQDALLNALSEDEAQKVKAVKISSEDYLALLSSPLNTLTHVHYSWLTKPLASLSREKTLCLLGLIPQAHAEKIKSALNIAEEIPAFSSSVKKFIIQYLAKDFPFQDAPVLAFVPDSDLSHLTHLQKQQIIELIDFLGLFDLAEEIHNIVDKTVLEKVNSALTPKKRSFIKQCLLSKQKLVTNRLNLEYWDGNPSKLAKLLHHRGMVRLGYALSGQSPDLIWHITHRIDSGRGNKLLRYVNEKEIPGVTNALKEQVHQAIQFFNKVK